MIRSGPVWSRRPTGQEAAGANTGVPVGGTGISGSSQRGGTQPSLTGGGRLGRRAGALSEGYPSGLPDLAPDLPPARHRLQTVSRARLCNLPPSWPVVHRQVFRVFQDFRVFRVFQDFRVFRVTRVFRRGLWLQLRLCHNSMGRVESERPIIILATLRIFRSNNSTRPGELRATTKATAECSVTLRTDTELTL